MGRLRLERCRGGSITDNPPEALPAVVVLATPPDGRGIFEGDTWKTSSRLANCPGHSVVGRSCAASRCPFPKEASSP